MTTLGLAAFVGLTGIQAGPSFVSALREAGIGLLRFAPQPAGQYRFDLG